MLFSHERSLSQGIMEQDRVGAEIMSIDRCIYIYLYIYIDKYKKQSLIPKPSRQLTHFLTPLQALLQCVLQKHMPRHVRSMRSASESFDASDRVFIIVVVIKSWIPRKELECQVFQLMLFWPAWPTA